MLVGMENLLIYFHEEPEYSGEILHRIMDFQIAVSKHYLAIGVEFANLGDDLGTQAGPLLGPACVMEFLYPEYRRLFDVYQSNNVMIGFHSCGRVGAFLDMFMDLGVDVLNPIQVTANNLEMMRLETAGRMALQGRISTVTQMDGPVEVIEQEVKNRLKHMG